MTREEFCSLPPAIALGLVYDMAERKLAPLEKPRLPLPPKFDGRLSRKGGMFVWYSEMLLDDLRYWHKQKAGETTGQYADKSQKEAKALFFWVKWRECYPDAVWSGERNKTQATAMPPSKKPQQHAWEPRGVAPTQQDFGDLDDAPEF